MDTSASMRRPAMGGIDVHGAFGLDEWNTLVGGWTNVLSCNTPDLKFSDDTSSHVGCLAERSVGSNRLDGSHYRGSPLLTYVRAFKAAGFEAHVTLSNLIAAFPNGYDVIAYLGGPSGNEGARIILSEGDVDAWRKNSSIAVLQTLYFRPRAFPDATLSTLIRTTVAELNMSNSDEFPVADYAVFDDMHKDTITLTVQGVLQGAGLCGFQIVERFLPPAPPAIPQPLPPPPWLLGMVPYGGSSGLSSGAVAGLAAGGIAILLAGVLYGAHNARKVKKSVEIAKKAPQAVVAAAVSSTTTSQPRFSALETDGGSEVEMNVEASEMGKSASV